VLTLILASTTSPELEQMFVISESIS